MRAYAPVGEDVGQGSGKAERSRSGKCRTDKCCGKLGQGNFAGPDEKILMFDLPIARDIVLDPAPVGRVGEDHSDALTSKHFLDEVTVPAVSDTEPMVSDRPDITRPANRNGVFVGKLDAVLLGGIVIERDKAVDFKGVEPGEFDIVAQLDEPREF